MNLATNEFVCILRKMRWSVARGDSDIDHFRCVQQSLAPTRIDQDDFEARRRAETAKYKRRIDAAQNLYLAGELSREEHLRRKEENERDIALWQSYRDEIEKVSVEMAVCVDAGEKWYQLGSMARPKISKGWPAIYLNSWFLIWKRIGLPISN